MAESRGATGDPTPSIAENASRKRHFRLPDLWPTFSISLASMLAIIVLALLATTLWLSVRTGDPDDPDAIYALSNFTEVFSDPFTWRVLGNTIGFSAVTLLVSLGFGLPAAWLAERTDLPGKSVLFTSMTIGLLIPGYASAMGWLLMMHPRIGLVNSLFTNVLGFASAPFNIASVVGMGWVQGLNLAPVAFIMTAAMFRAMDPTLEESAQMSGARYTTIARRIILPLAWPAILAAGIYIFTIGFAAFDVPAIIGWSNRIFTFSTYLLVQMSPMEGLPQYGRSAALSTLLIGVGILLSWWYGRLQSLGHRYQVITGKAYRPRLARLREHRFTAWGFLALYVVLAKILPLLVIVWASLLPFFSLPSPEAFASLGFGNFRGLPWAMAFEGAINTGLLLVLTPTITLVFCIAVSWTVLRGKMRGRAVFDMIAFLPHTVPNIVFSVGALLLVLYVVQDYAPIYGTIWILLIVFVVARASYGTRMTNAAMIQIHKDLEESALMAGASTRITVTRILAPLMAPTLIYAWLWIALMTFRELTLAAMLTVRGNMTLPVVLWAIWQGGDNGKGAAMTLVTIAVMTPFIVLYWYVARRYGKLQES